MSLKPDMGAVNRETKTRRYIKDRQETDLQRRKMKQRIRYVTDVDTKIV